MRRRDGMDGFGYASIKRNSSASGYEIKRYWIKSFICD
jgi:hypothetical protein